MNKPLLEFETMSHARAVVRIADDVHVTFWSIGNVVELRRDDLAVTFHNATADFERPDGERGIVNISDLALRSAQDRALPIEYREDGYPSDEDER